eukprot:CAMPEP_0172713764 /NCGR_PEP_ID=MMETSP1074-20121228/63618_1 /TAXON_ID=2916 /ORGANISM="Ceratium fusus, Strain PA161109" /LENGTH=352 /DNA_ID=CAMNT_0013537969 /DNA_START=75 /DNA_END=1133 /DNA_ORIENTATION=+
MSSAFDAIDRNHDGVITRAEFNQAMAASNLGKPMPMACVGPTMGTYAPPAVSYTAPTMQAFGAARTYAPPVAGWTASTSTMVPPTVSTAPVTYAMPATSQVTYGAPPATSQVTYGAPVYNAASYVQPTEVSYAMPSSPSTAASVSYAMPTSAPTLTYGSPAPATMQPAVTYTAAPVTYSPPIGQAASVIAAPAVPQAASAIMAPAMPETYAMPVAYNAPFETVVQQPVSYGVPSVTYAAPETMMQPAMACASAPIAYTTGASVEMHPQTTMTYGSPAYSTFAAPVEQTISYAAPASTTYTAAPAMTYSTAPVAYAPPMQAAPMVQQGGSLFDMLDRNHDGVISRAEFNQVMR